MTREDDSWPIEKRLLSMVPPSCEGKDDCWIFYQEKIKRLDIKENRE